MRNKILSLVIFLTVILSYTANAQISPGSLAAVHSHLEGMSNCTKCHELGDKVTNAKCLACHTELKARIDQNKGYHTTPRVHGKSCTNCHSDHHGLTFKIIRFDKDNFNHDLTGFVLTGAHAKKTCKDCHKPEFIANKAIRAKKFTYLGLNPECLGCHADYHQGTLSATCTKCHYPDAFKPQNKFSHAGTRFPLAGAHQSVACVKCHPITTRKGLKFQEFAGIKFANCNNCHEDTHQNKFGQNCKLCHTEGSFHVIKGMANFDHDKTNFKLTDKHKTVPCSSCHKASLTTPIKYTYCTDCHKDYHNGQFTKFSIVQNCGDCHTTKGFDQFSYTLEQHNLGKFVLEGAHLATPCLNCHKKTKEWSFRDIGIKCVDCHKDIHAGYIDVQYYPGFNCTECHNTTRWNLVKYDHSKTKFALTGVHAGKECRDCHFKSDSTGKQVQQFAQLSVECQGCHKDIHFKQFDIDGLTNCLKCHTFDKWKIDNFDHNKTRYKLDGKHKNVACVKCHKNITDQQNTYVLYKIREWKCENCH